MKLEGVSLNKVGPVCKNYVSDLRTSTYFGVRGPLCTSYTCFTSTRLVKRKVGSDKIVIFLTKYITVAQLLIKLNIVVIIKSVIVPTNDFTLIQINTLLRTYAYINFQVKRCREKYIGDTP